MSASDFDFPAEFVVERWDDPVVSAVGFSFDHPYVELLWLPVVGRSSSWLLRRLGARLDQSADGMILVDLAELACVMGLGLSTGRTSIVQRSLRRLTLFGLASWHGRLAVRTTVPPLTQRHLGRLTSDLVAMHQALVGGRTSGSHVNDHVVAGVA